MTGSGNGGSDTESHDPTVTELLGSLGSDHDSDLTPVETQDILKEIHPAVMGGLIRRWSTARDDSGQSSAEHPDFRRAVNQALDNYPEGYEDN
ncbi:hypothetical protein HLRTI_000482 [Halorhabdus tiamatea SARL4B]|uniref:Uncharacterized protein n=1 Tax=Halorhabdus tiamatea SARL4B TaxID=1033806 RepID=U2FBR5_9EURY|nr:hypothetical protein HLRTI_000482 [Halorhabdus tiamatea SARL4B]